MPVLPSVVLNMFSDGLGGYRSAVPTVSVNLTGQSLTSSIGPLTESTGFSKSISGLAVTTATNSLSISISTNVSLTGIATTSSQGSISRTVDDSSSLSTLLITSSIGSPSVTTIRSPSISLIGQLSTSGQGVISVNTGSIVDGSSYTITGTGFGTNTVGQEFLGGVNGPINSMSIGQTFRSLNRSGWTTYTQVEDSIASTTRSFTGYKTLLNDTQAAYPNDHYQFGLTYDTGARYYSAYARFYVYLDTTATTIQLKTVRFVGGPEKGGGGVDDGDTPNSYETTYYNGAGEYFTNNGGTPNPVWGTSSVSRNTWNLIEVSFKPDTTLAAGNGTVKWRATDTSTNTVVYSNSATGVTFWGSSFASNPYRYLVAQFYMGNYDPTLVPKTYFEELFFSWNASASITPKFVLMGDASTYSGCTKGKLIVQKINGTWSDTSIPIIINKGAHSNLTGKYFYIMSDIDTPINTSGIALV